MELGDFKETSVTLEDFTKEEADGATINSTSAANVAASFTLSSDQPDLEGFRELRESLMTRPGRQDLAMQEALSQREEVKKFLQDMPDIMLDENMSDEHKLSAINIAKGEGQLVPMGTMDRLSTKAFVTDSGFHETEAIHQSRSLLGDIVGKSNSVKREQQAAFNAFRQRREDKKGTNLVIKDLGELVIPFAEWIQIDQLNRNFTENNAILMGSQRKEIFDRIKNAPLDQKGKLSEQLIRLIEENDTVLLPDGNDLLAFDVLENAVINNDYSNFEKWFDNVVSVLDVIGVGSLAAIPSKSTKAARATRAATHSDVAPASPSQVVKETNPEMARNMSKVVEEDTTGEAAQALYGTTKEEALAKDILPEPEIDAGAVPVKPIQSVPQFPEPEAVRVVRTRDGESFLTPEEVIRSREKVIQRADDVTGFRHQPQELKTVLNDDGSTTFRMMFHPTDAGWLSAARALEDATFALRDFGTKAEDLVLYRRTTEGTWAETTADELKAKKALRDEFSRKKKKIPDELRELDYAVGIDYKHRFDPSDFEGLFDKMPVSRLNALDKLPVFLGAFKGTRGSLTQHLIPPRDLLDSARVVGPAAAAADRGVRLRKLFVEQFEEFAAKYSKLNKQDRARMKEYIDDANLNGIRFNKADLMSRGFNPEHVKMLQQWRRANDMMYHASNADMARSLRMRGRVVLTDGNENTLIGKGLKRGAIGPRTKWYDPTDGSIKSWSDLDNTKTFDEFYQEGGEIIKLETAIEVDGQWIDMAISYNQPNKSYTRAIREDEIVLAYRDGYYPVMYDANFIVFKRMKDANGNFFEKAVGTSKNRSDADMTALRLNEDEGEELFFVKDDKRSDFERKNSMLSGEAFEAATSMGLSFQKARGQRLFDASNLQKVGHTNLVDPLEAVANQVQVLSDKISMRSHLETLKARIIDNYKNVVQFPKSKDGEIQYPKDVTELKKSPNGSLQDMADARSTFNYVHSLETGYQNVVVDKGFKVLVNGIADFVEKGNVKLSEKVRGVGDAKPSQGVKGAAFKLYLAGNPQRQIVIQSAQVNQLTAVFPKYILGGGLAKDLWKLNKVRMGISKDPEMVEVLNQIEKAGFTVAVDANNLVRTESLRLADLKVSDKIKSGLNKPLAVAQKLGFDKGEQFVLITSWLAHRQKAIKDGKKLTARTYDEIAGDARAYTWDMNKAGEMPYTGNELNVIFQFLQVPHKASFQPFTNKQLTKKQKLQLITWNTSMYGIPSIVLPASVIAYMADTFGEDSEMITMLNDGMIDYMLNGVLTAASGEKQAIDFGDLKPTDIMGTATMATALLTTDLGTMISEAPGASLVLGNNPRITNFAKTVSKWVVPSLDYDNPDNQVNYKDVVLDGMRLFSGLSNGMKTSYAFKTNQKISNTGRITDDEVTAIEAGAQFFGFRTKDEEGIRKAKELIFKDSEFKQDDVRIWYNELKRILATKGMTPQQQEYHQRVLSEVWAAFEPWETDAQNTLLNLIEKDMVEGQYDFIYNLVSNAGGQSTDEVRKIVMQLPRSEIRTGLLNDLDLIDESIENWSN